MTRYSVQPRDRIFGYLTFAKNMGKKTCVVNIARNFLIMLKNLQQMHIKLLQEDSFKKELQMFQKIHNKIFQR